MKRFIISILSLIFISISANAQSVEEIISNMEDVFKQHENDGIEMVIDTKMLLMNLSMKTYTLGNKTRIETTMLGVKAITWMDDKTTWVYTPEMNAVQIENNLSGESESEDDADMFTGITDGYNVSIKKQTADAWYIQCTKSKTNKDKDAPKSMELVVAKETYHPISLSTKGSGMDITMKEIVFGVDEKFVTFNQADYPNVKVVDNRMPHL